MRQVPVPIVSSAEKAALSLGAAAMGVRSEAASGLEDEEEPMMEETAAAPPLLPSTAALGL